MSIKIPKTSDQEIKELLKKNLELNKEIHEMVKSIKTYIIWQRVWFVLKILIIAVPLILGFIYLPPILSDMFEQYKGFLNTSNALNLNSVDLNSLSPEVINNILK